MVRTRSSTLKEKDSELTDDKNLSVEEMANLAFSKMEEKLKRFKKEKEKNKLPELLLLPSQVEGFTTRTSLSSKLDPGIDEGVETSETKKHQKEIMKKCVLTSDFEKRDCAPPIHISRYKIQKMKKAEREATTSSKWFNMPAPEMTQELKNDLQILQMRSTLDRTHYYKSSDWKKLPKYFQVGRVIEGPGEFYSSRLPRKQRKRTIVEELLADEQFRKYQKRKYTELQRSKQVLRRKKGKFIINKLSSKRKQ